VNPVHYVYLFHSINSTHMVYQKGAFDAYDTILCVGPHHVAEIRETERVYGLKAKTLLEHGYGRLDSILKARDSRPAYQRSTGPVKKIVVAPSWGECSIIEGPHGSELIRTLVQAGHQVVLRLHPMTVRRFPKLAPDLAREFASHANFRVETVMNEQDSLLTSDVMISDWSGAATEFGFGLERPVIFIDTPKKVNNPEWRKVDCPPLEGFIRHEIGEVVKPTELNRLPGAVERLCANPEAFRERLVRAREKWIFNIGKSGETAAAAILDVLKKLESSSKAPAQAGLNTPSVGQPTTGQTTAEM
jgi:YidC/Oxa1 family membrane protein insertase